MADPAPTVADFQADDTAGQFVPVGNVQPDIVKHDPNTFAGLTAQAALQTMYGQGLNPTGDDIKGVFDKALQDANQYHAKLAQDQEAANLELKKRAAAVQSGVLGAEKNVEQQAALQKEEALQQWQQTGEIHRPAQADIDRVNGFESGYNIADKLQQYHLNMAATTPGAGGWLKQHILGFVTQPDITSQPTKDFKAYLESAIVPLGRGVFGDAATAATKESIQANMRDMLSSEGDNPLSAGHKTYMLKDRIMQNLITDRNNAEAAHTDTTLWDKAIGRLSSNFNSDAVRQFGPNWAQNNPTTPLVQNGTSTVGTATMDAHLIQSATQNQNQGYASVLARQSGVATPLQQPGAQSSPTPLPSPLPSPTPPQLQQPNAQPQPTAQPPQQNIFSWVR